MELSSSEFRAMNNPLRRFVQKHIEFRILRAMKVAEEGQDILEIGCGSGYGAVLLSSLRPRSYVGIDLMPEQVELAQRRDLPGASFAVMDATDLGAFGNESKDVVVIFGILHHIPSWRCALKETYRVLRTGGALYVEEPDGSLVRIFDQLFRFRHPDPALFGLDMLERELIGSGFSLLHRWRLAGFGFYGAIKHTPCGQQSADRWPS
jgi:ubiquinone/menaquinone biosynthesis C-methylase UbiE